MNRLHFETDLPPEPGDPHRADIACFVGFVGRRDTRLPEGIRRWLEEAGWTVPPFGRPADVGALLDLPVPIDRWDVFDRLFSWDRRDLNGGGLTATTYMGAAVRSFFAQGGRKCYVVRVGDPPPLSTPRSQRIDEVRRLIPGYPHALRTSPVSRQGWHGVGHLFGLSDVSMLCLPDLPELVSADRGPRDPEPESPRLPEQFVECSAPMEPSPADGFMRRLAPPRCGASDYEAWATAVRLTAELLARHRRDVQLISALPLPQPRGEPAADLLRFLIANRWFRRGGSGSGVDRAFVQLVYPWVRTPGSANLPGGLENPEAVLAGVLARNALTRGAFRSAAHLLLTDVEAVFPELGRDQTQRPASDPRATGGAARSYTLEERISLLGPTPGGLRLLSDVTASADESYRPAAVNRLVSLVVRAARRAGEATVFESSGESVWAELRERVGDLLLDLLQAGALHGTSPAEAFEVRCDRSTMTQSDLDNGRIIVQVRFQAAAPVERITVVMSMDEGGQLSLVAAEPAAMEAA
jgi:uncharacterized protein